MVAAGFSLGEADALRRAITNWGKNSKLLTFEKKLTRGMIARGYCATLVRPERRALRRSASAQAAVLLGGIVSHGAKTLVKSVAKASKEKLFGAAAEGAAELVVEPSATAPGMANVPGVTARTT